MGEEGKNMEDIFKDKFEGFSPTPPDGLWDKISSQMDAAPPPVSPKKPWWKTWRLGVLLFFLFFSVTGIIYNLNDEKVILNKSTNSAQKVAEVGDKTFNTNQKELKSSAPQEITSASTNAVDNTQNENSQSSKNKIAKVLPTENSEDVEEVYIGKVIGSSENAKKPSDSESTLQTEEKINREGNSNEFPKNFENDAELPPTKGTISGVETTQQPTQNKAAQVAELHNHSVRNDAPLLPFIIRSDIFERNKSHLVAKKMEEPEIEVNHKQPIKWYVGAYGGPSLVYRRFESNHSLMQSHKQSAESSLLSYDWGLEVVAQKGNWEIFIGLQMDRLGENYAYEGMKEVHDTAITQHQHPQDPTIWIYDTAVTVHHNHVEHSSNNVYTYFSIPLSIGYQFHLNEKFAISPIVTGGLNFLRAAETAWLDPETLDPVLHNSEDHQDAFRKVNFSNRFQIGFYYQLSDKFSLIVRPEATVLWQSVFNNTDFLNHRPYSFDANIGLRYQLR